VTVLDKITASLFIYSMMSAVFVVFAVVFEDRKKCNWSFSALCSMIVSGGLMVACLLVDIWNY
jgi:hypothetical protein